MRSVALYSETSLSVLVAQLRTLEVAGIPIGRTMRVDWLPGCACVLVQAALLFRYTHWVGVYLDGRFTGWIALVPCGNQVVEVHYGVLQSATAREVIEAGRQMNSAISARFSAGVAYIPMESAAARVARLAGWTCIDRYEREGRQYGQWWWRNSAGTGATDCTDSAGG